MPLQEPGKSQLDWEKKIHWCRYQEEVDLELSNEDFKAAP